MEEDDLMSLKLPRKLNFNAPILSTRRRSIRTNPTDKDGAETSHNTSEMVPFSWEEVPGTPKGTIRDEFHVVYEKPCPKIVPPSWKTDGCNTSRGGSGDGGGGSGDTEYEDILSDEMDMYSLDVEANESTCQKLDSFDLEIIERSSKQSPNFIIRRFLPAANALAYSYSNSINGRKLDKNSNPPIPTEKVECVSRSVDGRHSEPKACGIEYFFMWRKKLKPCGLKSPVVRGVSSPVVKLRCNSRR